MIPETFFQRLSGPEADTELLRRREVPTPEKPQLITRKGNLPELLSKPVSLKESAGMQQAELINRKDKKNSSIVRCKRKED
jgi:hypothetical protein